MSKDGRMLKNILGVNAAVDIARTREAQEKQLKLMERQELENTVARLESDREERQRREIEDEERTKVSQLAAIEKIHSLGLKIHHDQMEYVEKIALDSSIPLVQAAEKFRHNIIAQGVEFCLPENRETMDEEIAKFAQKYSLPIDSVTYEFKIGLEFHSLAKVPFGIRLEKRAIAEKERAAEKIKKEAESKAAAEKAESESLHPFIFFVIAPLALSCAWWIGPLFKMLFGVDLHR